MWVDEVDPGFAGFGDFMPEVDDLVHVWRLQFAPRDPAGSCGDTGKDCGVREKGFIKRDYNKFNKINF